MNAKSSYGMAEQEWGYMIRRIFAGILWVLFYDMSPLMAEDTPVKLSEVLFLRRDVTAPVLIELKNYSGELADIGGYTVVDGAGMECTIPAGTVVGAEGLAVLVIGAPDSEKKPDDSKALWVYVNSPDNSKMFHDIERDECALYSVPGQDPGRLIDYVSWGSGSVPIQQPTAAQKEIARLFQTRQRLYNGDYFVNTVARGVGEIGISPGFSLYRMPGGMAWAAQFNTSIGRENECPHMMPPMLGWPALIPDFELTREEYEHGKIKVVFAIDGARPDGSKVRMQVAEDPQMKYIVFDDYLTVSELELELLPFPHYFRGRWELDDKVGEWSPVFERLVRVKIVSDDKPNRHRFEKGAFEKRANKGAREK
ncbi:MAG: hypothetical protein AB7F40_10180 [Victivallaceae bacterium]